MEVSSHALALDRVAGVEFDVACVTNVWRDHLDFHGSVAEYRRAKARLFEHLRPSGLVVLNVDDPVAAGFICPARSAGADGRHAGPGRNHGQRRRALP